MGKYEKNLLALTAKPIPYYKDLRRISGSVSSAILFQQMEYWFSKKDGKPFYKFLSPPEETAIGYRAGDSWAEEMGFSEDEFRAAFKKIGVAHKSKKDYDAVTDKFKIVENRVDKRRDNSVKKTKWIVRKYEEEVEKMYCSYHNKRTGQTTYFRNHNLVNSMIDSLTK